MLPQQQDVQKWFLVALNEYRWRSGRVSARGIGFKAPSLTFHQNIDACALLKRERHKNTSLPQSFYALPSSLRMSLRAMTNY